jgi:hypothetical protein
MEMVDIPPVYIKNYTSLCVILVDHTATLGVVSGICKLKAFNASAIISVGQQQKRKEKIVRNKKS